MEDNKKDVAENLIVVVLFFLEAAFFIFIVSLFPQMAIAVVGQTVTVQTELQVGTVPPEVLNVTVNGGGTIDLTANATTEIIVEAIVRDFNGEADIDNVTSEFFDTVASSYGGTDDNNDHYTNGSCLIDRTYGTSYEANVTCGFFVEYYANNQTWNATVEIFDNSSLTDQGSGLETINVLLAVGLPDSIDYGEVNATQVSGEQTANVTNFGNVPINISLEGYAHYQGDDVALNCTLGSTQNISLEYEKYNLTDSNTSVLTLVQFEAQYMNLTNASVVRDFDLPYRQNDTEVFVDDTNSTFWRVYVPLGVAGTCTGNIIFGASLGAGS